MIEPARSRLEDAKDALMDLIVRCTSSCATIRTLLTRRITNSQEATKDDSEINQLPEFEAAKTTLEAAQ